MRLSGGYDTDPAWLTGRTGLEGTVSRFIPGQNATPAAVIQLDEPITAGEVTGDKVVLELRYAGAVWASTGTVHIERCAFSPEPKRWQERRQGAWVESHATYEQIKVGSRP